MKHRNLWPLLLALAVAGCGGGGPDEQPPPDPYFNGSRTFPGEAVVKVRGTSSGVLTLVEVLSSLAATEAPDRQFVLLQGGQEARYAAPAGWSLLDAAVHPSGESTVVLANDTSLRIVRLDARARILHQLPFADPAAREDPGVEPLGVVRRDSLVPALGRDAARIAAVGEDAVLAVRTGINAAVAYRFRTSIEGIALRWRTLVEPGMYVGGRFLTSGSYDTFGQLANHAKLVLDVDATGKVAVGVPGSYSALFAAHSEHFGSPGGDLAHGAIVTQLAADGTRLSSTIIDTGQVSELHGLRAVAGGFAAVGRVRTERRADGTGWDAYAAIVSADGKLSDYAVIDVDQGDVLFDVVPASGAGLIAVGATAYTQNPAGASISEHSMPLLVSLDKGGRLASRIPVPAGPRHNELRSLDAYRAGWLVGGMANGPGTHSGDADRGLLKADGWLSTVQPTTTSVVAAP